jgi:hypothetical protein
VLITVVVLIIIQKCVETMLFDLEKLMIKLEIILAQILHLNATQQAFPELHVILHKRAIKLDMKKNKDKKLLHVLRT